MNNMPVEIIKEDKTFHCVYDTPKNTPKIMSIVPNNPKTLIG